MEHKKYTVEKKSRSAWDAVYNKGHFGKRRVLSHEHFAGFWKFASRPSLCETPLASQYVGTLQAQVNR